jgi:SAM-dependent methyltransferase
MTQEFSLTQYIAWMEDRLARGAEGFDLFSMDYVKSHQARFSRTIELLDRVGKVDSAIEIGATEFFQIFLKNNLNVRDLWASIFSDRPEEKLYRKTFSAGGFNAETQVVSVNLEHEMFPVNAQYFELVLFCEVIEHLDVDPMFCMIEINRILKQDGYVLLTTPNSASARIAYKACLGYRPHFFMQYEKSRSPYRHNFEYDSHALRDLIEAAGFTIEVMETWDVFEATQVEAVDFLRNNKMPLELRGDDFFVLARKVSEPVNRWPASIYV